MYIFLISNDTYCIYTYTSNNLIRMIHMITLSYYEILVEIYSFEIIETY